MNIDVYRKFKLPRPIVAGLVLEITSPKGIRTKNEETGLYHYNLHTNTAQIYDGKPVELKDGLYWVVDIAKTRKLGLHWNHFLLEVYEGEADIIESYYNVKSTEWIPEALPTIKQHFRSLAG